MTDTIKKIAVLTGGGDCPGLNAVIRAVVKASINHHGWEVWGSEDSFGGFLGEAPLIPMDRSSVRGILPRGGTILGTSNRGNPFSFPVRNSSGEVETHDYSARVVDRFRHDGFDAMIVIGGDGTLHISNEFFKLGIPVVGVPKTIDNDLLMTEQTFGFDTALQTATDAIDKIHTTAESHDRAMVVEVMGRNSGWIALEAGIAGGADIILIPEIPYSIEKICRKIQQRASAGSKFSIAVVAEGAAPCGGEQVYQAKERTGESRRLGGIGFDVAQQIHERIGMDSRVVVLGHLQRGGSPSSLDRILGTRFGFAATDLVARGLFGQMVNLRCGAIESVPIEQAVAKQRQVEPDSDMIRAAKALGISFGDG